MAIISVVRVVGEMIFSSSSSAMAKVSEYHHRNEKRHEVSNHKN